MWVWWPAVVPDTRDRSFSHHPFHCFLSRCPPPSSFVSCLNSLWSWRSWTEAPVMKKPHPHRSVGPASIQHDSDVDIKFFPLTCPQSLPNGSHQQSPRESEITPSQVYMPVYFIFCPHMLVGWLVGFLFHAESVFKAHKCDESRLDLIASHN